MSFDHTPDDVESLALQMLNANAVREAGPHSATVYRFPLGCVVRPPPGRRGDQVAVTHRGETTIYDSPEALAAAVRDHDPEVARLREAAGKDLEEAALALRLCRAARARAEQRLEFIGFATFVVAAIAGVVAVVVL